MGYAVVIAPCFGCQQPFSFNPITVPSIRVNFERQPICRHCVERANPERIKNGLPPIVPAPDAYEPVVEERLHAAVAD